MGYLEALKFEIDEVTDPRVLGRTMHNLSDILIITVLAVICHAETFEEIEDFGHGRREWLSQFLELPNGIPSHDTFRRVLMLIDSRELELAFMAWTSKLTGEIKPGDILGVDGKTVKGTMTPQEGYSRAKLYLVSVWSSRLGLVLGQRKAQSSGNGEVASASELLDCFELKGVTIVGDAGVGKPSLAREIIDKGGDYVFPVKSNSRPLYSQLVDSFAKVPERNSQSSKVETYSTKERAHGRSESRDYAVIRKQYLPKDFNKVTDGSDYFPNLGFIGRVVYESQEKETRPFIQVDGEYIDTSSKVRLKREVRYFVGSSKASVQKLCESLRTQWAIENQLHWVLDVGFSEDNNRTHEKNIAQNLATIRKIGLNLVKQDKSRLGVKSKLKKAGWNENYLMSLLLNMADTLNKQSK